MTKKQMNVLFGAVKRGELVADMKDIKKLYGFCDMLPFEGRPVDRDICASLREAVSSFFLKDMKEAQAHLDRAILIAHAAYEF